MPFAGNKKLQSDAPGAERDSRHDVSSRPEEGRFSKSFFDSPSFMFISTVEDGIFVEVNNAFCKLTGYNRDEVLGESSRDLGIISAKERKRITAEVKKHGFIEQQEARIQSRTKGIRTVLFSAEITDIEKIPHFLGTGIDITERKRQQEFRDRDRELLHRLVDNIPVMMVKWDARLQRFEFNRHATEVLGWTSAEANRANFMEKAYPDPDYRDRVINFMKSLSPEWHEWKVTAKDGSVIPSAWANIQLSDESMVGIGIDLRERKKYERETRKSREELEKRVAERTAESEARADQLQQLAIELSKAEQKERQRLARILHDDLQQLLAAARFPLERLLRHLDRKKLKNLASQALDVVTQAMETSRSLSHELAPQRLSECSLAEGVKWCADWYREKFGLNVDVEIMTDAAELTEDTRLFLLESVRELLFNVEKHAGTDEVQVIMSRSGALLRIDVKDHGKGGAVSAAHKETGGTGLGLFSISERLKAVGGSMLIDSKAGNGTTISMCLPLE